MEIASQVQNCRTIDCSSQKLNTSGEKHDCPAIDCSNQKQNASAEKHELGSGQLQSEPVETMTIGSVAHNCQTTGSSILEQNTPDREHELGSKHVSSKSMDIKNLESVVEQKFHTSENLISEESTLGGKPESDSKLALGEPMEIMTVGPNAQNCQTKDSCRNEISSEHVQGEPMETRIVGSDSFEVGLSGTETRAISDAQNCQTTGLLDNSQTSDEKHKMGSERVSSEPMDIGVVESDAQDLQIMDSCHNELCSEVLQSEKMETNIVGSDSVDVGLSNTETMILDTVAQNCQTIGSSFLEHEIKSEHVSSEPMDIMVVGSDAEGKCQITGNAILTENTLGGKPEYDFKLVLGEPVETSTPGSNAQNIQEVELKSEHVTGEPVETRIVGSDYVDVGLSGTPPMCATDLNGPRHKGSTVSSRSKKRKSMLTSTPGTARALRPRLNGLCKPPGPTGSSADVTVEKEKKRKKIKRTKKALDDEFSRTRKRLRYILTRMGYEHNFIDAYSGEGWKGQSAEKIKPEKELQRATSEILRCKRKIRELFQHLDSSCAEGRFQESLFDSEGQISSEDIFCAKCQSQELSADNDIILCDGICDRGFHQMCLEPPLLKEEIPPGDEGWLCPGCDCKVDCIDILNDSQGTNLAIDDSWEKVFPEAAAKAAGDMTDDFSGLPSDDSEDDEYNPDAPEVEERVDSEGSSSDDSEDSDFTSASDDLEVRPLDDPYLGLPSDDSEDDEYDPNVLDLEQTKEDSSSSDFTSASEYFSVSNDAKGSSESEDGPVSASVDCSKLPSLSNKGSKMPRSEKQSVNSELLSILEPNSQGDLSPVSGKRQRERLDYKKLHDEAYGNVPSDSSGDEDWAEADAPTKKKDDVGESSLFPKANSQTIMSRRNTKSTQKKDSEETGNTSKRRKHPTKDSEGANNSVAETHIDSQEQDLVEKSATGSGYKTLGEAVTQEAYGNVPCDSSDGEDWADADAPSKKKDDVGESSLFPKANSQTRMSRRNTKGTQKKDSEETGNASKRRIRPTKDSEGANNSVAETQIDSPEQDLVEKNATGSGYKTLGEAVTQRLYESFKENQYPTRVTKEDLAKELGLRFQQISKWFENARSSLRRQSNNATNEAKKVSPTKDQPIMPENKVLPNDIDCNKDEVGEPSEVGTPKTLEVCPVKDATPPIKFVETETKICPNDAEDGTPKTLRNDDLDNQTLNDWTVVISIPANSPKTEEVGRKGRKKKQVVATNQRATRSQNQNQVATRSQIQTRSRKSLTPTGK